MQSLPWPGGSAGGGGVFFCFLCECVSVFFFFFGGGGGVVGGLEFSVQGGCFAEYLMGGGLDRLFRGFRMAV